MSAVHKLRQQYLPLFLYSASVNTFSPYQLMQSLNFYYLSLGVMSQSAHCQKEREREDYNVLASRKSDHK